MASREARRETSRDASRESSSEDGGAGGAGEEAVTTNNDCRDLSRPATIGEAAGAMRARLDGPAAAPVARISTDSRTIGRGDLFFALRGPTFDAHDFLTDVAAAGACGVVCESGRGERARSVAREGQGPVAILEVPDTLRALGDLAAWQRRGFGGPLVAITGSNGKTTTKEMLRAIFVARFGEPAVLATRGNLNNLIGVPLTLFGLGPGHEAAVVEMGMNVPGEIARLAEIARPTVGLVTCVAEAHLEGLGSIEGVARAKGELFEGLPPGAVAVVNSDDPHVVRESARVAGKRILFGSAGEVRASSIRCDRIDAASFVLEHAGARAPVELPLGGRHNVQNALGAAAAALAAGVTLEDAAAGLSRMTPPPMRMAAERLSNGVTLINDAYNANPGSLGAALATVGGLSARSILVIGDMLELGPRSAELHRRVGAQAAAIRPALVCAYGRHAADVGAGATNAGMDSAHVHVCARHEEAAAAVARAWLPGDAVLVKGSRGSTMERVVEMLRLRAGGDAAATSQSLEAREEAHAAAARRG
ncbi:MAG TPA: UDP-N-acetylmuramoyl-tripeptide--D-alanyl-D-alanine ligase [Candidatus Binatia bacterium]